MSQSAIQRLACLAGATILVANIALPAYADGVYRWKDGKGRIHVGDQPPAGYVQQGKYWVPARAKAKAAQSARPAAEQAAREAQQERQDYLLLYSYQSVADIIEARDQRLQAVAAIINAIDANIQNQRNTVARLSIHISNLKQRGKPVPVMLKQDIGRVREALQTNEVFRAERLAEENNIRRKYAADVRRFKELRRSLPE